MHSFGLNTLSFHIYGIHAIVLLLVFVLPFPPAWDILRFCSSASREFPFPLHLYLSLLFLAHSHCGNSVLLPGKIHVCLLILNYLMLELSILPVIYYLNKKKNDININIYNNIYNIYIYIYIYYIYIYFWSFNLIT